MRPDESLTHQKQDHAPTVRRAFRCRCGRPVFFRNSACLACGAQLGYDADRGQLLPLAAVEGQKGRWRPYDEEATDPTYGRCANFESELACNWLVTDAATPSLCRACRLTREVADLSDTERTTLWPRIELAKRRLVSQLVGLRLPLRPKSEDPEHGLAFDFLASRPGQPPVMTGHDDGVITLNIEEADPATRERVREQMREPYRTLLGHLRHEVGHYYWDRLVRDSDWLEPFRGLFGDERQDYAAALQTHYEQGPPADWPSRFVSAYAASHPWEDWAESWAHYLHMIDSVDTALSFGIDSSQIDIAVEAWGADALWRPEDASAPACLRLFNAWTDLTTAMNEMSRSMGQPDFYPFVLPRAAVAKLQFIHLVIQGAPPSVPVGPAGCRAQAGG